MGYHGLLSGVTAYRKQQIREYLEHDDDAKLTPTLAHEYPSLTAEFDVYDWECPDCGHQVAWNDVDWNPDKPTIPICPECATTDTITTMRVPFDQ